MLPIRGYHPYRAAFQLLLVTLMARLVPVRSPLLREYHIDFLSSGYLDVSVPRVCFFNLYIQLKIPNTNLHIKNAQLPKPPKTVKKHCPLAQMDRAHAEVRQRQNRVSAKYTCLLRWVSPFGNRWIKAYSQLTNAYRSVSRPSSPPSAKASTKRPCNT